MQLVAIKFCVALGETLFLTGFGQRVRPSLPQLQEP